MYRVDLDENQPDKEFGYQSIDGHIEKVVLGGINNNLIDIYDDNKDGLSIFNVEDIPNLIKALQMAYDVSGKKKIDSDGGE